MKSDRTADFFKVYKIFIVELLVRFCNCLSCPDKPEKLVVLFAGRIIKGEKRVNHWMQII